MAIDELGENELTNSMGSKTSKPNSPLTCILKEFNKLYLPIVKEVYDYSNIKRHLQALCETEWPTYGVDGPSQGTSESQIAWAMVDATLGKPAHPNQIGYILL